MIRFRVSAPLLISVSTRLTLLVSHDAVFHMASGSPGCALDAAQIWRFVSLSAQHHALSLPGQFLSVVYELAARTIRSQQSIHHTGLGALCHFQLGVLCAKLCLYPTRVYRVHLDLRVLQLGGKVHRKLVQR